MLRWSTHAGQGVRLGTNVSATRTHWVSGLGLAAWVLAMAFNLALLLAALPTLAEKLSGGTTEPVKELATWLSTLLGAVYLTIAFVLLRLRAPGRPWRLVTVVLFTLGLGGSGVLLPLMDPARGPDAATWFALVSLHKTLEIVSTFYLVYVYPDGRLRPRWLLALAALNPPIALWTALHIGWDLYPALPTHVLGFTWTVNMTLVGVSTAFVVPLAVLGRWQRLRQDRAAGRKELLPSSWSLILLMAGLTVYQNAAVFLKTQTITEGERALLNALFLNLCLAWFPVTLLRLMLRSGLRDERQVAERALSGLALGVLVGGGYLAALLLLTRWLDLRSPVLLAALAALSTVLLFAPVRDAVQRRVSRLLYGQRHRPMQALAALSAGLERASTPQGALGMLARTTAETLRLPGLRLRVSDPAGGRVPHEWLLGTHSGTPEVFPLLVEGGVPVGELAVWVHEPLDAEVRAMLGTVAGQAAQIVRAWNLSLQVQRSREVLVETREDERRRLRRELHDGLGPTLAAQTLRIGSARVMLSRDPGAVDGLLSQLESDIQRAIGDVRRVVENLRPPALDDLGLVKALRRAVDGINDGLAVQVCIQARGLPQLPAAVEVAAYRIVMEAVTNVVCHAHATRCTVSLTPEPGALLVEIEDDARGEVGGGATGVGLSSMREHAEELGGTFVLLSRDRGTLVRASLPLRSGTP